MNIDAILFDVFLFGVAVTILNLSIWIVMHFILCRKFDAELFRSPYFRETELYLYDSWPLSLFKSMGYMLLLAFPRALKKRRFHDVVLEKTLSNQILAIISRLFMVLMMISLAILLMVLVSGTVDIFAQVYQDWQQGLLF